jgi:adenine C2-methylase RlmN of 23S rRNA A2503 and tRNA A37
MGMGEPLYNLDNVVDAVGVLSDPEGLSLSRRRITVSTSGIVPEMARLGVEANTMLAISLHAVRDDCATNSCRSTANTRSATSCRRAATTRASQTREESPSST